MLAVFLKPPAYSMHILPNVQKEPQSLDKAYFFVNFSSKYIAYFIALCYNIRQ